MIDRDALEAEIRAHVEDLAEVREYLGRFAEQVRDYWRSVSPIGTKPNDKNPGMYAASVKVFKKNYTVDGMPAKKVGATDFKAGWIEYGTGEPGPTRAFAPRAKTAAHFSGDEARVEMILSNSELSFEQRQSMLSQFDSVSVELGDEQ